MKTCDLVVTYDVNTETREGRRRLRQVAKLCQQYGQRVQFSVFEVRVTEGMREELEVGLQTIIDESTDSIRLYELLIGREKSVTTYGVDKYRDFDKPLVV